VHVERHLINIVRCPGGGFMISWLAGWRVKASHSGSFMDLYRAGADRRLGSV
jgi:hypothetical protein